MSGKSESDRLHTWSRVSQKAAHDCAGWLSDEIPSPMTAHRLLGRNDCLKPSLQCALNLVSLCRHFASLFLKFLIDLGNDLLRVNRSKLKSVKQQLDQV